MTPEAAMSIATKWLADSSTKGFPEAIGILAPTTLAELLASPNGQTAQALNKILGQLYKDGGNASISAVLAEAQSYRTTCERKDCKGSVSELCDRCARLLARCVVLLSLDPTKKIKLAPALHDSLFVYFAKFLSGSAKDREQDNWAFDQKSDRLTERTNLYYEELLVIECRRQFTYMGVEKGISYFDVRVRNKLRQEWRNPIAKAVSIHQQGEYAQGASSHSDHRTFIDPPAPKTLYEWPQSWTACEARYRKSDAVRVWCLSQLFDHTRNSSTRGWKSIAEQFNIAINCRRVPQSVEDVSIEDLLSAFDPSVFANGVTQEEELLHDVLCHLRRRRAVGQEPIWSAEDLASFYYYEPTKHTAEWGTDFLLPHPTGLKPYNRPTYDGDTICFWLLHLLKGTGNRVMEIAFLQAQSPEESKQKRSWKGETRWEEIIPWTIVHDDLVYCCCFLNIAILPPDVGWQHVTDAFAAWHQRAKKQDEKAVHARYRKFYNRQLEKLKCLL